MSDKPLVQQALASELAELLLTIPSTDNSLAFLSGFWEAIVREWNGIDRLRYVISAPHFFILIELLSMDKYYMLVRRFVNASFRLLMRGEWKESACTEYNSIMGGNGGPLW